MKTLIHHWRKVVIMMITVTSMWLAYQYYFSLPNTWIPLVMDGNLIAVNPRGSTRFFLTRNEQFHYEKPFVVNNEIIGVMKWHNSDEKLQGGYCENVILLNISDGSIKNTENCDYIRKFVRVSPNGSRWASFSKEGELVVTENNIILFRSSKLKQTFWHNVNPIAWSTDNQLLVAVDEKENDTEVHILSINIDNGSVTELCVEKNLYLYFQDGISSNRSKQILCNGNPQVEKLFGSLEWPVSWILPSTYSGGRYYFYLWSHGNVFFGSHQSIEGYDIKRHRAFTVKTLQYFGDTNNWVFPY